ncbi:tetratricopeptide repeat protein [Heyndrickxia acidiproducens]|uniref:tetratricopeptide repeat protein n=1 Tax=Heyndrickxia acidiproducens TaxID=1121084 RepID=UPI0003703294|nr:hypothetical protein [Heyndrickxia acidiproducens]
MTTQLTIVNHKQTINVKIERMAVYLQSRIVEAIEDNGRCWYLFFYKGQYLTSTAATKLKRRSFMERAFRDGVVLQAPHPLIGHLLHNHQTCKKTGFQHLTGKIEKLFTPQETAFIATFFESFVPKRKLFEYIQAIFYEYRRNGQLLSCYRILRILMDFAPKQSWVKQLSRDLNFIKYEKLYQSLSPELIKKDSLYAEKKLYEDLSNDASFQSLIKLLQLQNRWIDETALWIKRTAETCADRDYAALSALLNKHFPQPDAMLVIEQLFHAAPRCEQLRNDLINYYIETKQPNKIIPFMLGRNFSLTDVQVGKIESLLESLDVAAADMEIEPLNQLAPFFAGHPQLTEKFLQTCVTLLFRSHELPYIAEWLLPFKKPLGSLPVIRKVEKMLEIADDPDHQSELGELYYQFKQYDKAIDCFSWEMELKGSDPNPVKWLSKIYNEMGMKSEYKAYQNLYIDMEKRRA